MILQKPKLTKCGIPSSKLIHPAICFSNQTFSTIHVILHNTILFLSRQRIKLFKLSFLNAKLKIYLYATFKYKQAQCELILSYLTCHRKNSNFQPNPHWMAAWMLTIFSVSAQKKRSKKFSVLCVHLLSQRATVKKCSFKKSSPTTFTVAVRLAYPRITRNVLVPQ